MIDTSSSQAKKHEMLHWPVQQTPKPWAHDPEATDPVLAEHSVAVKQVPLYVFSPRQKSLVKRTSENMEKTTHPKCHEAKQIRQRK